MLKKLMSYNQETQKEVQEVLAQQVSKQYRLDTVYINMAKEVAQLSYCQRHKVGALLVKEDNIIGFGYNGAPSGMDNCCERDGVTLPHIIHAEVNVILKAARTGNAVDRSTLYLTLSPCIECSKIILQSGIERVVYLEEYRSTDGIKFLKQFIKVEQYVI